MGEGRRTRCVTARCQHSREAGQHRGRRGDAVVDMAAQRWVTPARGEPGIWTAAYGQIFVGDVSQRGEPPCAQLPLQLLP
jgi:hypothetical protein